MAVQPKLRLALAADDESRAFLRDRLLLQSKLMFWSFAIILGSTQIMYLQYPMLQPTDERAIIYLAAAGILQLAIVWQGFLARRELSLRALRGIDAYYAIGTGVIFGGSAILARDFRPSAYGCMFYTCFIVLLRAIVVPSSGKRTAVIASLTFLPMVCAAAVVSVVREHELPPAAFIVAAIIISVIVILFGTVGSNTIYGLRKELAQLGQYTLGRKIGAGGMGEVYEAQHALLRRPTAIKLLQADREGERNIERFEREVQHMSQLTHPNTVAVYDYGRSLEGRFYYAMEYLDGLNLESLVERYGAQPAGRAVHIVAQVCGALAEAHAAKIIHRDIKPANIILCVRGGMPDVAKVVDYGLVKEVTGDVGSTMQIEGTLHYLAPETIDGDKLAAPVDIYGVGATLYYLLTGKPVFEGNTPMDVCAKHLKLVPAAPSEIVPGIPAALDRLVLQCLAKKPSERPSAARLAAELAELPRTDWTTAQAQTWWDEFRASGGDSQPVTNAPTMKVTVNLQLRKTG